MVDLKSLVRIKCCLKVALVKISFYIFIIIDFIIVYIDWRKHEKLILDKLLEEIKKEVEIK